MDTSPIKSTPKDVFLHLFQIATFYISIVSFLTLWVQYINALFPDPLNFYFLGTLDAILWSTSVLLITFPLSLLTAWLIERDLRAVPEKRELKIRKWLVYFTLFLSAITIAVSLVFLVYNFLKGELSVPFSLKIVITLIVAAAVFGYYLWDLKRTRSAHSRIPFAAASISIAITLASIVMGFILVGTPATQRARRFDERRVSDLSSLQYTIMNYWTQKGKLPDTLKELEIAFPGSQTPKDPEKETIYGYRVTGQNAFELCAEFGLASDKRIGKNSQFYPSYPYPAGREVPPISENWEHKKGNVCFTRTFDPDVYKPVGNPEKIKPRAL